MASTVDEPPLGKQLPYSAGCLTVLYEQGGQFVVSNVDPPVPGMAVWSDCPRLVPLIPPGEDRPLLSLQRQSVLAGGPHAVLVSIVEVVVVMALEVVRDAVDVSNALARPVLPFQLDVDTLEPVRDQLLFVPGLSHAGRLLATGLSRT
ncbi:hypothetical protein ACH40F_05000 [Streptomyces sp. NPDC020794]|uniref:hypothetical protein n=1 Tax=unclassified Streptomyces TaxID=2593676 RepID=UPI0036EEE417